ncbi:MAG: hypothetical protein JWO56_586 [Acidobacteria bacterium]|nr:hypothetical protein [Acidobacteriota bacterium]
MKHYSEADLLETYYMQPGQSMPVMMHLASCSDCAARYTRLERKLHEAASCETAKHDTFWTRQRLSIMRRISTRQERFASIGRVTRVAAAAVFAFAVGGAVMYKAVSPALEPPLSQTHPPVAVAAAPPTNDTAGIDHDPWQSEELQEFHGVVQWESWVDGKSAKGDAL